MNDILGVDFTNPVMTAFFSTLVLIFVISPVLGYVVVAKGTRFSTVIAAFGVGLLTLVALFIGLNLLMGNQLKDSADNDPQVTLVSLIIAIVASLCVGSYVGWTLSNPRSAVQDELQNSMTARPDESLKYMAKRRERLEKKRRR